jgi:hypothetical protein
MPIVTKKRTQIVRGMYFDRFRSLLWQILAITPSYRVETDAIADPCETRSRIALKQMLLFTALQ